MPKLPNLILAAFLITAAQSFAQTYEKRVTPVAGDEAQSFKKQTKVALVVGVSQYPNSSGLSPLHYAASDAEELGASLKAQGYLVNVLTNGDATRGGILHTLQSLQKMVDEQSTFLFYFSGHGFAIDGKNYLAPISASETDLAREGLPVQEVEQVLVQSKAKRQIMLLDACRNDPVSGTKGTATRSFANLQASEGLRILNSTRSGDVSYESVDLKHGVFTAYLLEALRGEAAGTDGLVTFHDLSDYVALSVRRWGVEHGKIQIPFEAVGTSKEASGDFLLAQQMRRSPTPEPVTPAPVVVPTPATPAPSTESRPPYGWPPALRICATVAGKSGCATWLWQGTQYLARNDDGTSAHITFDGPQGNGLVQVTQKGPNGLVGKYIGSFNAEGKGSGSTEYRWLINKVGGTWTGTPLSSH